MPEPAAAKTTEAEESTELTPMLFGAFLHQHRAAGLHNEAGDTLAEVVAAVRETQKKGEVTIKLVIEPAKGDDSRVVISDELKAKLPKHPTPSSLFYTNPDGVLSRRDPRQPELPLRDASAS